jgi:hypothetical protein
MNRLPERPAVPRQDLDDFDAAGRLQAVLVSYLVVALVLHLEVQLAALHAPIPLDRLDAFHDEANQDATRRTWRLSLNCFASNALIWSAMMCASALT